MKKNTNSPLSRLTPYLPATKFTSLQFVAAAEDLLHSAGQWLFWATSAGLPAVICRLCVATPPDSRSTVAIAFEWSFTIMTISAEMVVPGLVGYWLDQKLGTQVLFLLLGLAGGCVLAAWSLARVARRKASGRAPREK